MASTAPPTTNAADTDIERLLATMKTEGGERRRFAEQYELDRARSQAERERALAKIKRENDEFRRKRRDFRRRTEQWKIDDIHQTFAQQQRLAEITGRRTAAWYRAAADDVVQQGKEAGVDLDVKAPEYRDVFQRVCWRLNLSPPSTVLYDVVRGSNRGYAWCETTPPRIEVEPIVDAATFVVATHEAAHIATAAHCATYPHVPVDPKFPDINQVCVGGEILAWRQVISWLTEAGVCWTPEMHGTMTHCLGTYAPYGTARERDEIAALCSSATRMAAVCASIRQQTMEFPMIVNTSMAAGQNTKGVPLYKRFEAEDRAAVRAATACVECGMALPNERDRFVGFQPGQGVRVCCAACDGRRIIAAARERRRREATWREQHAAPAPQPAPPLAASGRTPLIRKKVLRDGNNRIVSIEDELIGYV
jgi:hypothetical protein